MKFKSILFMLAVACTAINVQAAEQNSLDAHTDVAVPMEIDPVTTFIEAVHGNGGTDHHKIEVNAAFVQELIKRDPSLIKWRDSRGATLLHGAAEKGDAEAVRLLLENHALVDAVDQGGSTALSRASNEAVAELLCNYGADVNHPDNGGLRPLFRAASKGHEGVALVLLEHGAYFDSQNPRCKAMLYAASRYQATFDLLQEWPVIMPQRARDARLTLCMAMHPRCGANSTLHQFKPSIIQQIAHYVRPRHFSPSVCQKVRLNDVKHAFLMGCHEEYGQCAVMHHMPQLCAEHIFSYLKPADFSDRAMATAHVPVLAVLKVAQQQLFTLTLAVAFALWPGKSNR